MDVILRSDMGKKGKGITRFRSRTESEFGCFVLK